MSTQRNISALEEVLQVLKGIPFDQVNTYRLHKEMKDAYTLLAYAEVGEISDAVVKEVIRVPVQLSLLAIEEKQKQELRIKALLKLETRATLDIPPGDMLEFELGAEQNLPISVYEPLYNFVARYFQNPCEIRVGRVEDVLREGIQLFPLNSVIPMELGRVYYGLAVEGARSGKPGKIKKNMAKVQDYFQIAAERTCGVERKTIEQIRKIAYTCLPEVRGRK